MACLSLSRLRMARGDGRLMADFTTWSALKTQILNDFSNRNTMIAEYRTPLGTTVKVRTITEFKEAIEMCDANIAAETGDLDTYAQFDRPRTGI